MTTAHAAQTTTRSIFRLPKLTLGGVVLGTLQVALALQLMLEALALLHVLPGY